MNRERIAKFEKWWTKCHHHTASHTWLTKHTKRVIHNYNVAPEQYEHAVSILKRFNLSEYKRIRKDDAEFLWRTIHPSMNERRERLLATAMFLQEKAEINNRKFSK